MLARHIQYNPEFDSLPKPGNAAGNGVTPTLLKDGKQLPLSHRTESFDSKGNGSDLSNNSDGLKVPAIARPSPNSGTASNASSIRLTERRHSNSLQRPASMDVYGSSNLGNGSSSNLRTSMNEQQLNKLQASREKAMLRSPLSPSPSGSEREKARARVSSMSQTHGLFPSNPSEHVRSSSTASLVSRGEGSRPALEGAFSPHQRIRNMSASHLSEWDRPAHSRHVSDDGYRQQSQRRASLSPNNASPHLPAQQPLATNGSSSRNSRQMEPSHSGRRHSQVQGSSMPRSLSRADDVARRMSTFDNGLDPLYAPPQPWMNHPNHSGGSLNLYPNSAPCSAHHSPALGYAGLPTPGGSSPNPFAAQFGPAAPTAGPWGYHMPPSMPVTMSMPYGMPPAMHMNPSLGLPSMPTGMMGLPMVPSMASMQASPGGMHLTVIPPSSSNIAASMTPPLTPNQFEKVQMSGGGKRRESRHY
ncbi:hypothetical protein IE53DRAFT_278204 [Violaceomyces palustris]|uniref:Uncharacterized protein n=1 Tax=Violaceomyces palustris TaxID=1673888 RepID=A0ACD0P3E3_9BASI|nr:hypothetical protein IE53DRAFT_278204 [Violaceomyces palustris]